MKVCKTLDLLMIAPVLVLALGALNAGAAAPIASCVDPAGNTCLCKQGQRSEQCVCDPCSGDGKCLCITALRKETGTISGVVHDKWVKKYRALVYIERMEGTKFPPPKKPVAMDQKAKVFVPHILPIVAGTTVDFLNADTFDHNVFSPDGEKYDLGKWGQGQKRQRVFPKEGLYVQLCKIHPEMVAYILVLQNPYFTFADKTGKFSLRNVPPGNWKVKVWHERLKPKKSKKVFEVAVAKGKETALDMRWKK